MPRRPVNLNALKDKLLHLEARHIIFALKNQFLEAYTIDGLLPVFNYISGNYIKYIYVKWNYGDARAGMERSRKDPKISTQATPH
jgi:hypothetical protein